MEILWVFLNTIVFLATYHKYLKPQYSHLHSILGRGLCISRASAGVINLNTALVLLPVCRGLNSLVFRALSRVSRPLLSLWLTHLKHIHVTLAITIVISAVIHSAAHVINSVNFSLNYDPRHPEINWAKFKGQSPLLIVLSSTVGLTGVAMLLILFLLLLMSLKCVRERHYDLFWATHFLFLPFMICLILHPLSGILKEQNNYPLPDCDKFLNGTNREQNNNSCVADPAFVPMECQGWLWVVVALGVFSVDFVLRLFRRHYSVYRVRRVVDLPGGVTHLSLQTSHSMIPFKPGQYILLQCPQLSSLEWHPFTITSVSYTSSHTNITLLIRKRGDWTKAICRMLSNKGNDRILPYSYTPVRLLVDGPFCSPLENVLKTRFAICVAAGIGITPFVAVLHHLLKSDSIRWRQEKPQHLHLVWVVRTHSQLSWAADLVTQLHNKCWATNQPDKFDFSFYVTRGTTEKTDQIMASFSNLVQKRTHIGRPDWAMLFMEWTLLFHKKEVTIFTCGPTSLHQQVKSTALRCNRKGSHFYCVQETFS